MTIIDLKQKKAKVPIWLVGVFTFILMLAFSGLVMEAAKYIIFNPNYPKLDRLGRALYEVPAYARSFYGGDLWVGIGWYIVNWIVGVVIAILLPLLISYVLFRNRVSQG